MWKHAQSYAISILDDPAWRSCRALGHKTAIFSYVRRLVAIWLSADSISRFYELKGKEGRYIVPPSIPIFSSVSASKRFDHISNVSDKPDRLSTVFENPCIRKHEEFYHPHGIGPLCGCHPGRSHCSWGSRSPSRKSLRTPCSVHILRRYWCRVYAIRPAEQPPIQHEYVPSLFDTGTSS